MLRCNNSTIKSLLWDEFARVANLDADVRRFLHSLDLTLEIIPEDLVALHNIPDIGRRNEKIRRAIWDSFKWNVNFDNDVRALMDELFIFDDKINMLGIIQSSWDIFMKELPYQEEQAEYRRMIWDELGTVAELDKDVGLLINKVLDFCAKSRADDNGKELLCKTLDIFKFLSRQPREKRNEDLRKHLWDTLGKFSDLEPDVMKLIEEFLRSYRNNRILPDLTKKIFEHLQERLSWKRNRSIRFFLQEKLGKLWRVTPFQRGR